MNDKAKTHNFRHDWVLENASKLGTYNLKEPTYVETVFWNNSVRLQLYPQGWDDTCRQYMSLVFITNKYMFARVMCMVAILNTVKNKKLLKVEKRADKYCENYSLVFKQFVYRSDLLSQRIKGALKDDKLVICCEGTVKQYLRFTTPEKISRAHFNAKMPTSITFGHKLLVENFCDFKMHKNLPYIESPEFFNERLPQLKFKMLIYTNETHNVNTHIKHFVVLKLAEQPTEEYNVPIAAKCSIVRKNQEVYHEDKMELTLMSELNAEQFNLIPTHYYDENTKNHIKNGIMAGMPNDFIMLCNIKIIVYDKHFSKDNAAICNYLRLLNHSQTGNENITESKVNFRDDKYFNQGAKGRRLTIAIDDLGKQSSLLELQKQDSFLSIDNSIHSRSARTVSGSSYESNDSFETRSNASTVKPLQSTEINESESYLKKVISGTIDKIDKIVGNLKETIKRTKVEPGPASTVVNNMIYHLENAKNVLFNAQSAASIDNVTFCSEQMDSVSTARTMTDFPMGNSHEIQEKIDEIRLFMKQLERSKPNYQFIVQTFPQPYQELKIIVETMEEIAAKNDEMKKMKKKERKVKQKKGKSRMSRRRSQSINLGDFCSMGKSSESSGYESMMEGARRRQVWKDTRRESFVLLPTTEHKFNFTASSISNDSQTKKFVSHSGWIPVDRTVDKSSVSFQLLSEAVEGGIMTDITFLVDGQEYHAHKNILSVGSKILKQMCEQNLRKIEIHDVRPEVWSEIRSFLYIGKVESVFARELLVAAYKLEIVGLQTLCEQYLTTRLTVQNAEELYHLAKGNNAKELMTNSLEFIRRETATAHYRQMDNDQLFQQFRNYVH